ncbi:MAG: hypothetical protein ABIS91_02390 [Nocardioides sp.]|uniref:hypothetical protein n=1 Tax=Nocardioides sp. TaxID=35761 RepID=UPI003262DC5A
MKTWDGGESGGTGVDAVFDLDRRLEPGDSWETDIQYQFRPQGCTSRGTHSSNAMEVEARAWGRSVRVAGAGVYFDGTTESSC